MTRPHPSPGQASLLRNLGQMVGHVVQAVAQPVPGSACAPASEEPAADDLKPDHAATGQPVPIDAELVERVEIVPHRAPALRPLPLPSPASDGRP